MYKNARYLYIVQHNNCMYKFLMMQDLVFQTFSAQVGTIVPENKNTLEQENNDTILQQNNGTLVQENNGTREERVIT